MLFAFLLFGTPWFWGALLLPALFLLYLIENEKAFGALFTVLITGAVFVAFGDKALVPWVVAHPLKIAEYAGAYVLIGILWGFVKWFFQVLRARDTYEKVRKDFVSRQDAYSKQLAKMNVKAPGRGFGDDTYKAEIAAIDARAPVTGFDKALFKEFASREHGVNLSSFPPKANDNKGKIIFWMSYWPFSATWTLINDPITRLYRFIYRRLGAVFEKISHAMFAKYKDDLAA